MGNGFIGISRNGRMGPGRSTTPTAKRLEKGTTSGRISLPRLFFILSRPLRDAVGLISGQSGSFRGIRCICFTSRRSLPFASGGRTSEIYDKGKRIHRIQRKRPDTSRTGSRLQSPSVGKGYDLGTPSVSRSRGSFKGVSVVETFVSTTLTPLNEPDQSVN